MEMKAHRVTTRPATILKAIASMEAHFLVL